MQSIGVGTSHKVTPEVLESISVASSGEIEFSNSEIDNFSIEKVKKQLKNNIVLEVKKNILLVKVH